jgi:ribonucleoside-diphosphate reductase alpha chain
MQAAIQKHIDSCISSTVNLPADITLDEVEKIYFLAWKLGCKGITVYREGSREGILVTEDQAKAQQETKDRNEIKLPTQTQDEGMKKTHHPNPISSLRPSQMPVIKPIKRPQFLQGFTEVIKTGYGNLYVTINTYDGRPFEVFVQIGKSGYSTMADAEATGRLVSLALRSGVSVKDVVEQLEGIGGSSPVFSEGKLVMSIPDAIATVLKKHFVQAVENSTESARRTVDLNLERCPDCGDRALAFEQGCMTCRSCGFSKCD